MLSSTELAAVKRAILRFEKQYTKYARNESPDMYKQFMADIKFVKGFANVKTYERFSDRLYEMDTEPSEYFFVMLPTNLQSKIEF